MDIAEKEGNTTHISSKNLKDTPERADCDRINNHKDEKPEDVSSHSGQTSDDASGFYVMEDNTAPSGQNTLMPSSPEGKSPVRLFLKIILTPVDGWKELKRSKITPDRFAQGCFYPLLALMAVSVFAMLFYVSTTSIQTLLIEAIIAFISFFLGYFIVGVLLRTMTYKDCAKAFSTDFGNCFVMVAMSSLTIVQTLINILPFIQPVLVFLPLYTIYIIVKGVRFLRIETNHEALTIVLISILSIGVPALLHWIFSLMLPA